MFNRYSDITNAVYQFAAGTISVDELAAVAARGHLGRAVNPNRICTIVAIYNLLLPVLEAFITGLVLPPMPTPPQCLAYTAADAKEHPALLAAIVAAFAP